MPFGVANSPINTQALEHYEDVISTCLQYGVTPIVTLIHIDSPALVSLEAASLREYFLYHVKQVKSDLYQDFQCSGSSARPLQS